MSAAIDHLNDGGQRTPAPRAALGPAAGRMRGR